MDKRKLNGKTPASRKNQADRTKMGKADPTAVKGMYDQGMTLKEIGKVFDVSAVPVLKFFKRNGIPRRSKSEIGKTIMGSPEKREHMRKVSIENYLRRRKFSTGPEKHFEVWLTDKLIRYETQYRKIGNGHPYDFFLPDHNLLVEIDGHYWHTKPDQRTKDLVQTEEAIRKGYHIVRIDTLDLKTRTYEELLGDYIELS